MDEAKVPTVEEYLPFVKFLAKKLRARLPGHIDVDDLISSGVLGLMDAIEKYDPRRTNQFKTYAEFRIRGAMLDYLRDMDWTPRSAREKQKVVASAQARAREDGIYLSPEEAIRTLADTERSIRRLRNALRETQLLSIEGEFSAADKRALLRYIVERQEHQERINFADYLEGRDLYVINRYAEGYTLQAIGLELGFTESRASQITINAIAWIRSCLANGIKERKPYLQRGANQLKLREAS